MPKIPFIYGHRSVQTCRYSVSERKARQIAASLQQLILMSFVVRFRVRRTFTEMLKILAGHLRCGIVAGSQPSLPVPCHRARLCASGGRLE
jgi:hypothetical protein